MLQVLRMHMWLDEHMAVLHRRDRQVCIRLLVRRNMAIVVILPRACQRWSKGGERAQASNSRRRLMDVNVDRMRRVRGGRIQGQRGYLEWRVLMCVRRNYGRCGRVYEVYIRARREIRHGRRRDDSWLKRDRR